VLSKPVDAGLEAFVEKVLPTARPRCVVRPRFVHNNVVHLGHRVDTEDGSRVYFLCENKMLLGALFGGPGHDKLPMYEPGVEAFHVFDDADCMTCIVVEGRRRG
jgi:hypothetical protein